MKKIGWIKIEDKWQKVKIVGRSKSSGSIMGESDYICTFGGPEYFNASPDDVVFTKPEELRSKIEWGRILTSYFLMSFGLFLNNTMIGYMVLKEVPNVLIGICGTIGFISSAFIIPFMVNEFYSMKKLVGLIEEEK